MKISVFSQSCLTADVICFDEFKQWLFWGIETEDDVPKTVWDMIDLQEKLDFVPLKQMGFNPYWVHTNDEDRGGPRNLNT